ncbi:paxillin-like isoform X2 [Lineus longissimus]|uniref:paxillin-like isoform X2 n=1 Tax=Lineus longissimus TaxID=88925 RepID=UPI00315D3E04
MPAMDGQVGAMDKYWYFWSPCYVQLRLKLGKAPEKIHPIDALLAELQSKTQQNYSQQQQQTQPQAHQYPPSYGSSSPSPRGSNRQSYESDKSFEGRYPHESNVPIYEPQNVRQVTTVTKTQQSFTNAPAAPPSSRNNSTSAPPKPPAMSNKALGENLSELDSLLMDLSTPQFISEVDRKSGVQYNYNEPRDIMQAHSGYSTVNTSQGVDSLLDDLQNSVPSTDNHYQGRHGQFDKGKTTSAATKELDDLMNSLSDFKMNPPANAPTIQQQHQVVQKPVLEHVGEPPYARPYKPSKPQQLVKTETVTTVRTETHVQSGDTTDAPPFPRVTPPETPQPAGQSQNSQQMMNQSQNVPQMMNQNSPQMMSQSNSQTMSQNSQLMNQNNPQMMGQNNSQSVNLNSSQMMAQNAPQMMSQSQNATQMMSQQQTSQAQQTANLDSMLGNLQSDMNRQGVSTIAKGHCAACNKPIVGQVITALGRIWHPEHFTCKSCDQELGTQNFFERDGHSYCERDYHSLFAPRCAFCNGPILDQCVTALDKTWHTEHFVCAQCHRPFDDGGFHEKNGKPYCRDDYFGMFAPRCGGCNQPIMDNYISALNKQWHPECFVCQDCHMPFSGGSFFDHDGFPYCEMHYHAKRGSLCAGCQKPITGRCITAMYKKFHPEHFVCAFCLKQLNKGTFKEQNEKPYCHSCFVKLFG